jgi:hypothetical protein
MRIIRCLSTGTSYSGSLKCSTNVNVTEFMLIILNGNGGSGKISMFYVIGKIKKFLVGALRHNIKIKSPSSLDLFFMHRA